MQLGVIPPWLLYAIIDITGVMVGQAMVTLGENVRTGVTAVLLHTGQSVLFREEVPRVVFIANGLA